MSESDTLFGIGIPVWSFLGALLGVLVTRVLGPAFTWFVRRNWPGKEIWRADTNVVRLLPDNLYQRENYPHFAWTRPREGRWSTRGKPVKDSYFRLDLGRIARVTTVRFSHGMYEGDYPTQWELKAWAYDETEAKPEPGQGPILQNLGGRPVRYITVTALAEPEAHPPPTEGPRWWSIADIEVKERPPFLPWPEWVIR